MRKKIFQVLVLCALSTGSLFSINEARAQSASPSSCKAGCGMLKDYCNEFAGDPNLPKKLYNFCLSVVNNFSNNVWVDCSAIQIIEKAAEVPCSQVYSSCMNNCYPGPFYPLSKSAP